MLQNKLKIPTSEQWLVEHQKGPHATKPTRATGQKHSVTHGMSQVNENNYFSTNSVLRLKASVTSSLTSKQDNHVKVDALKYFDLR